MNAPQDQDLLQLRVVLAEMRAGHWVQAHNQVQLDNSPLAAWLHGILHIEEGDLEDAEYWYGKAGQDFRSRGTLAEEVARWEAALATTAHLLKDPL